MVAAVARARTALEGVREPRVALVERGADRLTRPLVDALAASTVVAFDAADGMDRIHLGLTTDRPWDLVLDVAGGQGAVHRWPQLLHHLRAGGTLLVAVSPGALEFEASVSRVLDAQARGAESPTPGRDPRRNADRDLAALAASAEGLRIEDGFLVAVNRVATLAKIPETSADGFLEGRADARVLATVPAVHFESRCVLGASGPVDLPTAYDAPAVSLREYDDAVCLGRQAAYGDGFVLPESYRHPFKRRLRNVAFAEWAPRFVRDPGRPSSRLEGSHFLADSYVRGHFGHALTDQVGHLWGWKAALARHPDLRALVFARPGEHLAPWEDDLLGAAGIDRERVVVATEPVVVERLLATSPMFGMPAYAHPALRSTYETIGRALAAATGRPGPRRVFCSRRPGKRTCHNADDVEALFSANGFEVVFPEDHSLAEQARIVRDAETIAGFAGSGMFQIGLAGAPKHVILVASESYTATNEYLLASILGHRLDLVLCRPDLRPTGDAFSAAVYHSDFTFDPGREGRFLRGVLDGL